MGLQLRRDFGSLKKSDLFALLALMALSLLSMGGDGVLSLWAALTIPYVLLAPVLPGPGPAGAGTGHRKVQ